MDDAWNEGYVTEIGYTHGYYRELSPSLQRFALLAAGYAPPDEGAYLELGSGQGLSACIHAAATPCDIWATDFNPGQALNARQLLKSADIEAQVFDQSFAELAQRDDLPKFTHIAGHGIWTWISDTNRTQIVDVLQRHLTVGGAAYLSYNTLPGWGSALSLRHMMCLHAEVAGTQADGVSGQIDNAIAYVQKLVQTDALYFRTHPEVVERLKQIQGADRYYIAHEYFNRNWQPMHFADFAKWLAPAKLEFAASAHLLDQVDELNLSNEAQALLKETGHVVLRENLRDFYVNQFFRRDIFLRGCRKLSALEQYELLDQTRFALQTPWASIPLKMECPVGEVGLQEAVYIPLLELMAHDAYRPIRLSELRAKLPKISMPQILQSIKILIGLGHVHPAQDEKVVEAVRSRTVRLNREICRRARFNGETMFLASPVIGAGVMVQRIEQLFLLARSEHEGKPENWARTAWGILEQQAYRLKKEGRRLESPEENIAELNLLATAFAAERLAILQTLGVA
ncbi:MAG: methyltransferase regulatory domain-containing protein [Desulfobulbaceae bacterium]|nr:methyltransferase regulatory domain-containing protein [Desulfobulbaceae bacterium]HIJ89312.1 methyltransferase [Deltaproteobacteria bacterium]